MLIKQQPGVNFKGGTANALLWAPEAKQVALLSGGKELPMQQQERGVWMLTTDTVKPGDTYQYRLDDKDALPDPASLAQPEGVHGPSQAVDLQAYQWKDSNWKGLPLSDYIIYELHTGTFSEEGNFKGIEAQLDYLKELGITAIELMPVAAFPGNRNWGYDGVFPYAVHNDYGGPEGLMQLVDACHAIGLAVVLDVVYNHMGPEGNYLGSFGPYFTDKYKTPWGSAINFDDAGCDAVRQFFIQNALMWLRDFHIDALRMDAVHAIRDFGARHFLQELREEADKFLAQSPREQHLIVECDLNDTRFINPLKEHGFGMDAQWSDEFHHALRVTAGEKPTGYLADFNGLQHLAKAYEAAYVYDDIYSPHRDKTFGSKALNNPGTQFVVFSQNHDQVGNRMLGERTAQLVSFEMQKLMAAAVIISPYIPLLFMGEEFAAPSPFQYFVSHTDPELVKAVREGRRNEFAAFQAAGEAPDPQSEETFNLSKLTWNTLAQEPHATMLRYYKALLELRKTQPALVPNREGLKATAHKEQQVLIVTRNSPKQQLVCYLNFSAKEQSVTPPANGKKLLDSAAPVWNGPATGPEITAAQGTLTLQPESILIYSANV